MLSTIVNIFTVIVINIIEFRMWFTGHNRRTYVTHEQESTIMKILFDEFPGLIHKTETHGLYRSGQYYFSVFDKSINFGGVTIKFKTVSTAVMVARSAMSTLYKIKVDLDTDPVDVAT